jgi:hypothetical protein
MIKLAGQLRQRWGVNDKKAMALRSALVQQMGPMDNTGLYYAFPGQPGFNRLT